MKTEQPFITFEDAAVRIRDRLILPHTSWEIKTGQHWAVLGHNGAGKTSLMRAVTGELPVVRGRIIRHYKNGTSVSDRSAIGYVSFELHRGLMAREEIKNESRFFSGSDGVTTAREIILTNAPDQEKNFQDIVHLLQIRYLLDRGICFLSSGEIRKVLIARAMIKSPRLLILDEPFEGLDADSRSRISESVNQLMNRNMQVILVTHRQEEIPPNISHALFLKDCKIAAQGKREDILSHCLDDSHEEKKRGFISIPRTKLAENQKDVPAVLVAMRNTTVKYGRTLVLKNLNWTVKQGENWAITGPNGAGKTTLLSLITGDNLQAYANEIYLFGRRRGTGESIWEIRQQIGVVSPELQIAYRQRINAGDVVVSGFFDSVGLYRRSTREQQETACQWMENLGISHKAESPFDQLSCGEQRVVLLARAVVKSPLLLILDEPCQGLDISNRHNILELAEFIGRHTRTHLLYVTHHPEETPACISKTLEL
jgi:molybdate transport system ATP-binding protein